MDLPDPGIEPVSPVLQEDSLATELSGKPIVPKHNSTTILYCFLFFFKHLIIIPKNAKNTILKRKARKDLRDPSGLFSRFDKRCTDPKSSLKEAQTVCYDNIEER